MCTFLLEGTEITWSRQWLSNIAVNWESSTRRCDVDECRHQYATGRNTKIPAINLLSLLSNEGQNSSQQNGAAF